MRRRFSRNDRLATATLVLCLGVLSPPARGLRGSGGWQRDGRAPQCWDIDLTRRDDTTIEARMTLLRKSHSGASAVIDRRGDVVAARPFGVPGTLSQAVALGDELIP